MDKEKDGNLVWVDLEMTGLDVNTDHIIEMACIVTDKHLNVIAEGEDIVIHQPDNILERMNEWCVKTHRESGNFFSFRFFIYKIKSTFIIIMCFVVDA